MRNMKWIGLLCGLAIGAFVAAAGSVEAEPGKEQGSSSGQPFLNLADEIAGVEGQIEDLAGRIDDNEGDIDALEFELFLLEQQLDALQGVVNDAECAPGYALQDLNGPTCVQVGGDGDLETVTVYTQQYAPPGYPSVLAYCPAGYARTGCGFFNYAHNARVRGSYPLGSNICSTNVWNPYSGSILVTTFATCSRTQ